MTSNYREKGKRRIALRLSCGDGLGHCVLCAFGTYFTTRSKEKLANWFECANKPSQTITMLVHMCVCVLGFSHAILYATSLSTLTNEHKLTDEQYSASQPIPLLSASINSTNIKTLI